MSGSALVRLVSEIAMIKNRPKYLYELPFYQRLPDEFAIGYGVLPKLLNLDIDFLPSSLQPIVSNNQLDNLDLFLQQEALETYSLSKFQLIFIVANISCFKKADDGQYYGLPYAISIIPSAKRDGVQFIEPELATILCKSELLDQKSIFTHFDPFNENFGLWICPFSGMIDDSYCDEVGFVIGAYFLANNVDLASSRMPIIEGISENVASRYHKYRRKRYFKPIEEYKPRKIWGCDSPIELFLLQALQAINIFPVVQTLVFQNGEIFPNYYDMALESKWVSDSKPDTEIDLFLPEYGIAIFCDSKKFHRGARKKASANRIDKNLMKQGIISLRFSGKEILTNIAFVLDIILEKMAEKHH